MDGRVYSPGAGHRPPVLAGRDELLRSWQLKLHELAALGRPAAEDGILIGPRGVGKTVTLTAFTSLAAEQGFEVVNLQAVAGRAGLVHSLLQRAASRLDQGSGAWTRARHAFDRIASISFGVAGVSATISTQQRARGSDVLDPGTLAEALVALASEVRRDAPAGGVFITVDEMQVAAAGDLALLAATLHRLNVDHPDAAALFAGTGLPHTPEVLRGAGVTHPDRLFALEPLPVTLARDDARYAIIEPARRVGVAWEPAAADAIVTASNGYPAHVQAFAHAAWRTAPGPHTITEADAQAAIERTAGELEKRSFEPRWERMSGRQMEYLAALALHNGRADSGEIAATLGRTNKELSWLRQELIEEGDIYVPRHGQVALAVPLFGPYILARYDDSRRNVDVDLLSLGQMRHHRSTDGRSASSLTSPHARRPLSPPAAPPPPGRPTEPRR